MEHNKNPNHFDFINSVEEVSNELTNSIDDRGLIWFVDSLIKDAYLSRKEVETVDDDWMVKIWEWAEKFNLIDEVIPSDKDRLLNMIEFKIEKVPWVYEFVHEEFKDCTIEDMERMGLNCPEFFKYNPRFDVDYIPEEISNLKKLEVISVEGINVDSLLNKIGKLENLKRLKLSLCEIKRIPEDIGKLSQLESLAVSHNYGLKDGLEYIFKLTNLKSLVLEYCHLDAIPKGIGNLNQLTALNLESNNIQQLTEELCCLKKLESLNIKRNKLRNLPDNISNLKSLKRLEADSNMIETLPDSFTDLEKLEEVNLMDNKLNEIPKNINKLTNLKACNFGKNEISRLPFSILELEELEAFYIHYNSIDFHDLPHEIEKFLKELNNFSNVFKYDLF